MRIVVAMSGGVDSSVTAALLKEQGHEVIGLSMKTHGLAPRANRACCTPDDMRDARVVADILDIPFYVLPYEDVFKEKVILPFAKAYQNGMTPNPCIECNDKVKFVPLLERSKVLGAERLATGHYARIDHDAPALLRGVDDRKDQSYFLYRLRPAQLNMLMFPLGGMVKAEVRDHARRLGLPLADKAESQEICFVGEAGYAATVEKILGEGGRVGNIVDEQGKVLGQHQGIHKFTLGQRRGLGISAPNPLYVTRIDADSGDVVVGGSEALLTETVEVEEVVWCGWEPSDDEVVSVQLRYRGKPHDARVMSTGPGTAQLELVTPQERGAPGQAAVIYRGDRVLGGGRVSRSVMPPMRPALRIVDAAVGAV